MTKVLVTGADGFIGSHLTEALLREGYKVKALSQYNSFNYWGWLEDIKPCPELEVVSGDIRDPHFCKHITKDVDMVFHLAALIAIPFSYVAPDIEQREAFLQQSNGEKVITRPAWMLMNELQMFNNAVCDAIPHAQEIASRLVNIPSSFRPNAKGDA